MGLFNKVKAWLRDDYCIGCTEEMKLIKKQLFALPALTVGHYEDHSDPNYYETNLVKVKKKAEIPPGVYACGAYLYQCPKCQKKVVKLTIFLPVRDQEQVDGVEVFENGEMVEFLERE